MNNIRTNRWKEDIDMLSIELPKGHKNLFFKIDKEDFYKQIENLKRDVEFYDDYEIMVEIAKIAALACDAHTYATLPVRLLCPIELYWFSGGIYVISTSEEYKEMLYFKVARINGIDIKEVINVLSSIISYENQSFLRSQLPKFIPAVELLYGLELVDDFDGLIFTYESRMGDEKNITVKALPSKEAREKIKATEERLELSQLAFYRKNPNLNYWFEYMDESKTLYFNYTSCRDMQDKNMELFIEELITFINANKIEKLAIDLRNNSGGDSTLLDSFIQFVSNHQELNKRGKLFVIIGRETFSSALLNAYSLKENTEAIFIGEESGGKPNCYGEVQRFSLKNSGILITYSTKYYKLIVDDSKLSFEPDIYIDLTIDNYINNEDPCLEYVLNYHKKDLC